MSKMDACKDSENKIVHEEQTVFSVTKDLKETNGSTVFKQQKMEAGEIRTPVKNLTDSEKYNQIMEYRRKKYDASRKRYVVFLCSFLLHFTIGGFNSSLGVIFVDVIQTFDSGRSEASLMQSLSRGIMFGGGVLAEVFLRKMGTVKCLILGGVILSGSMLACQFVNSILALVLLVGVGGGIGLLFPILVSTVTITRAFSDPQEAVRYMALMVSGGGLGFIVMPYVTELILEEYGWRGTFLIFSGIFAHNFVAAVGYRFYLPPVTKKTETEKRKIIDTRTQKSPKTDFSIFRNPMYMTFLVVVVPYGLTGFIEPWFLPDYVVTLGYAREHGAILMTVIGVANFVGRISAGMLTCVCQRTNTSIISHWVYIQLLLALSHALYSLFPTYSAMFGASILYGFVFGLILSQCSPVILESVGRGRFDFAQGVDNTVYGIFTTLGGAVAGSITDVFGGYEMVFYFGAILNLFAAFCCLLLLIYEFISRSRRKGNVIFITHL